MLTPSVNALIAAICFPNGSMFIGWSLDIARDRTLHNDRVDESTWNRYIYVAGHRLGALSLSVDLRVWRLFAQLPDPA